MTDGSQFFASSWLVLYGKRVGFSSPPRVIGFCVAGEMSEISLPHTAVWVLYIFTSCSYVLAFAAISILKFLVEIFVIAEEILG